jgi:hypothetical protein
MAESDPKATLQARRVLWKSQSIGGDAEGLAVCSNEGEHLSVRENLAQITRRLIHGARHCGRVRERVEQHEVEA